MLIKNLLKKFQPLTVLVLKFKYRKLKNLSNNEIFSIIYKDKLWNRKSDLDFDSGPGSHAEEIVEPYIAEIRNFLTSQKNKLKVIDLGCGDFNIGKNLVEYSKEYVGVDVVTELIERNKKLFIFNNLKFINIDIVKDPIPSGDCVLIREVLQHLTNSEVGLILNKLKDFKLIIITENIPLEKKFRKNLDKLKGPKSRLYINSGLVIEDPPFNFKSKERKVLLKILRPNRGYIITTLYQN